MTRPARILWFLAPVALVGTLTCGGGGGGSSPAPQAAAPVASFTTSPASPVAGQTVTFTDTSTGSPTAWSWNFGDGVTTTAQNPTHIYASAGAYTVSLTATNVGGAGAAVTHTVTVAVPTGVPFSGTILLGAPTTQGIKASVFSATQSGTVYLAYGKQSGSTTSQTIPTALVAGTPLVIPLTGLSADTGYVYRLYFTASGATAASASEERAFHTARLPGSTFTFTIQADSHLDGNSDLAVYQKTLANVLAEQPDFHVDLGDTFMCEKYSQPLTNTAQTTTDNATLVSRYVYERGNFGAISHSVPIFLTNGNHEGESGWLLTGTADCLPVWAALARQKYFLNPTPDAFYSGDASITPLVGQRASYYAWTWGDALFVVLDPFWNTTIKPGSSGWTITLGKVQYDWLAATLAGSAARYKFVFIHNLVGGLDGQMRGGVEAAPYFESGGENDDGSDGFAAQRSGWAMPIHRLMVQHGVTALFHGHDHLYDHQLLDGIHYQEVPQPSAANATSGASLAAAYHYASGTILSSSGHLKVTVAPTGVTVRYIRTWLPSQESAAQRNGSVDDAWSVGVPAPAERP